MDQKVIKSQLYISWIYFFSYLVLGILLEGFILVVLSFSLGILGGYIENKFGFFPKVPNLLIFYFILIGIAIIWLRLIIKKSFTKNEITVNDNELTIIKDNITYTFPLRLIKKISISSGYDPTAKVVAYSEFFPLNSMNTIGGMIALQAYKLYYLTIEYLEGEKDSKISFSLSSYRGTTSIAEALSSFGIPLEREDQDIVERIWDKRSNRIPFIVAGVVFFIAPGFIWSYLGFEKIIPYSSSTEGFDSYIFSMMAVGFLCALISFFLTRYILNFLWKK